MSKEFLPQQKVHLDSWLLSVVAILLMLGVLMVTSASSFTTEKYGVGLYHYSIRQMIYIAIGIFGGVCAYKISMEKMYIWSSLMVPLAVLVLVLVLIPGIGREVNGAMRWIFAAP